MLLLLLIRDGLDVNFDILKTNLVFLLLLIVVDLGSRGSSSCW